MNNFWVNWKRHEKRGEFYFVSLYCFENQLDNFINEKSYFIIFVLFVRKLILYPILQVVEKLWQQIPKQFFIILNLFHKTTQMYFWDALDF